MTEEQMEELLILHSRAVKAATLWQGATPGTQTRRRLEEVLDRAEVRFRNALIEVMRG